MWIVFNYDFSRHLSDTQFEWLVRDILQEKLGLQLENFKDGKDGWIDIRYSHDLNNEIIIQCKKYKNITSLKSNLKKEVQKVINIWGNFKYLLATSVGLSDKNKQDIIEIFDWIITDTKDIISEQDLNNFLWQEKYQSIRRKYRRYFIPPWEDDDEINIDYQITYQVEEINPDLEDNLFKAQKEIRDIDEKVLEMHKKKEERSKNKYGITIEAYEIVGGISKLLPSEEERLLSRKKELQDYIKNLEEMKWYYKNWKRLIFHIKNTWNIYDENINIKVEKKRGVILDDDEIDSYLRYFPSYPKNNDLLSNLASLNYKNNEPPYRKEISNFHYALRYLHIWWEAEIFYSWEWIIVSKGELEFNFHITSKHLRWVIKKSLKLSA